MSDGALDSLHGREPQFMKLGCIGRRGAAVERRGAGAVWHVGHLQGSGICRIRGAGGFSSGVVHGGVVEAVAAAAAGALVGMAMRSRSLNLRYHCKLVSPNGAEQRETERGSMGGEAGREDLY